MSYVTNALGTNEKIILHARKHPIVLFWVVFAAVIALAALIFAAFAASREEPDLVYPVLWLCLVPPCFLLYSVLKWWNEEYYLTSHRIIQTQGVINKRIVDSSLEKVNDVVFSQWWLERLLDFGDIEILTASDVGVNRLDNIRSPLKFKIAMMDQKQFLSAGQQQESPDKGLSSRIPMLISYLDELKKESLLSEAEFQEKKKILLARQ